MIGFLRGKLVAKAPPLLLLDVNGVGYEIEAPMTTFYDLPATGEQIHLHTHLVVREDAQILFGFSAESERGLFRTLIKVSGVGPKLALTILSGLSASEFQRCVSDNDAQALVRLPGIGKKTAERLIIEMRDRLPATGGASGDESTASMLIQQGGDPKQEALSALVALGYKPQDAGRMIQSIDCEDKPCEAIIRMALQGAGK